MNSLITVKNIYMLYACIQKLKPTKLLIINNFHTSKQLCNKINQITKWGIVRVFEDTEKKDKETFLSIINIFIKKDVTRRGHFQFIQTALQHMDKFNVNNDLESYKAILNVFPKKVMIPKNKFQMIFYHYPKHQNLATEVLSKMEDNGVIGDVETETILLEVFDKHALPLKKFWRMMYWMPKFVNLNPWPVPKPVTNDLKELARLAIKKISSVDTSTKITEFETKDLQNSIEDTWIISAMSVTQKELLKEHWQLRSKMPIFVEGPFTVWVANKLINYFQLRTDAIQKNINQDTDDITNINIPFWEKSTVDLTNTVHNQEDGIYLALCATGTSTKNSLLTWIQYLQQSNIFLKDIPIVFKLASPTKEIAFIEQKEE